MCGYASDETEELMPLSILLAHLINRKLADLRRDGTLPWAGPDSKSQVYRAHVMMTVREMCPTQKVTVEYRRDNGACVPLRVHTVVISVQHRDGTPLEEMRVALREQVAKVCVHESARE